jgi:AbrB family looped-hinge helix DNA binding protein
MPKITSRGQVTVPKRIRDYLGLKPGREIEFVAIARGDVLLKPVGRRPKSPFDKVRGSATAGLTTDEIMRMTRGEDWGRDES